MSGAPHDLVSTVAPTMTLKSISNSTGSARTAAEGHVETTASQAPEEEGVGQQWADPAAAEERLGPPAPPAPVPNFLRPLLRPEGPQEDDSEEPALSQSLSLSFGPAASYDAVASVCSVGEALSIDQPVLRRMPSMLSTSMLSTSRLSGRLSTPREVPREVAERMPQGRRRRRRLRNSQVHAEMQCALANLGLQGHQLENRLFPERLCRKNAIESRTGVHRLAIVVSASPVFVAFCSAVIVVNLVYMGFRVDGMLRGEDGNEVRVADHVFLIWFIVELNINCAGSTVPVHHDWLIMFDLVLVFASIVNAWILLPLGVWEDSTAFSFLVVFRIMRFVRLARNIRRQPALEPIHIICQAIWRSLWDTVVALLVLAMIIFANSIVIVSVLGPGSGTPPEDLGPVARDHFSSVSSTALSLLETLVCGLPWGDAYFRPLVADSASSVAGVWLLICSVVVQLAFTLQFTGLLIDTTFRIQTQHQQDLNCHKIYISQMATQDLMHALEGMDDNQDRMLSWEELDTGLRRFPSVLVRLRLKHEQAKELFEQLQFKDQAGTNKVSIDEFVFGLIKATQQSKTVDMLVIDYQQQKSINMVGEVWDSTSFDLSELQAGMQQVRGVLGGLADAGCGDNFMPAMFEAYERELASWLGRGKRPSALREAMLSACVPAVDPQAWSSCRSSEDAGTAPSLAMDSNSAASPSWARWSSLLAEEAAPVFRGELSAFLRGEDAPGGGAGPLAPRRSTASLLTIETRDSESSVAGSSGHSTEAPARSIPEAVYSSQRPTTPEGAPAPPPAPSAPEAPPSPPDSAR